MSELIDELKRRSDACVICLTKRDSEFVDGGIYFFSKGGSAELAGLIDVCEARKAALMKELIDTMFGDEDDYDDD